MPSLRPGTFVRDATKPDRCESAILRSHWVLGRTKREIIRCLKRCLAREIYQRVMTDSRARQEIIPAA